MSDGDEDDLPADVEQSDPPASLNDNANTGVGRRRNKLEMAERNRLAFWKRVLADEVGRQEIAHILLECGTFGERHAAGPNGAPDPDATAYYRGRRDVGLKLYLDLEDIDIFGVHKMRQEHFKGKS